MFIIAKESFISYNFFFFEEGKCNMYGVYLFKSCLLSFLLTQILEILMVDKVLYIRCFFDYKTFSKRMTNHLEIKNVLSWKFLEKARIL